MEQPPTRDQVAPEVGSSPTQLPVAAVPDVADASAKAVAGHSGAGEVGVILLRNSLQNSWLREMLSARMRELQYLAAQCSVSGGGL